MRLLKRSLPVLFAATVVWGPVRPSPPVLAWYRRHRWRMHSCNGRTTTAAAACPAPARRTDQVTTVRCVPARDRARPARIAACGQNPSSRGHPVPCEPGESRLNHPA